MVLGSAIYGGGFGEVSAPSLQESGSELQQSERIDTRPVIRVSGKNRKQKNNANAKEDGNHDYKEHGMKKQSDRDIRKRTGHYSTI